MHRISVVVPVFNEAGNLEKLFEKIETAMSGLDSDDWEALFVDDGSTDSSDRILDQMAQKNKHVRALHFTSNQGQTAAMDAGFRNASGELIITMDADLQNDPKDIPLLLAQLEDGIGCVCGVRVNRQDTWLRKISSRIANGVRNWLSDETITDTGCSLKLFRKKCFDDIMLFEGMHRFLPTLVKMSGYKVVEVPVSHHPRFAGESKYGVWNRVFKSFFDLLAVRWMKRRKLRYQIRQEVTPAK